MCPMSIAFLYLKCVCTCNETGSIRILAHTCMCVREEVTVRNEGYCEEMEAVIERPGSSRLP